MQLDTYACTELTHLHLGTRMVLTNVLRDSIAAKEFLFQNSVLKESILS